ncbi:MAG: hypothetical protein KAJ75_04205, partial [Alphaproteobacteria bacterium]|nr:hypothetical protein [Alphaproteobacteria bacterium]
MTKTKEATPFKCKLRRKIFDFVKAVLKSAAMRPLLEAYICFAIKKINKNPSPEIGFLVLDVERFWPGDLERLGERTQLWEMTTGLRTFLHALFFTTDEMHLIRTYKNIPTSFLEKEKLFTEWFRNLIEKIGKRKGFNCILTCNYLYVQNRLIAKACKNSQIPFINHSRENCLDKRVNQVFKDLFNAQGFDVSFHGDALCVYNHNMKDFLCDLNVTEPERIHVIGSLRTDMLVKRLKNLKELPTKKQVTL